MALNRFISSAALLFTLGLSTAVAQAEDLIGASVQKLCLEKNVVAYVDTALKSQKLKQMPNVFKNDVAREPVGISLNVLTEISNRMFKRQLFFIQDDLTGLSGASFREDTITLSRRSYDSVAKKIINKKSGIGFIIAHEIAHFIQSLNADIDQMTKPVDLSKFSFEEKENILHAQTDCIALNILERSEIVYSKQSVIKNLSLIKEECNEVRSASFCADAFQIRLLGIRNYLSSVNSRN